MPITEGGQFSPNNNIASAGVFTREIDLSNSAQGIENAGAAIVAPFPKGPGFRPTMVRSVVELEERFGTADGVYYGPYTAKEYLRENGSVTVTRVGALTGYKQKYPFVIYGIKGAFARNLSVGALDSDNSVLSLSTGTISDGFSGSLNYYSGSSNTLSISSSLTIKFEGTAADVVDAPASITSSNGGVAYSGQTVSLGNLNVLLASSSFFINSSVQTTSTGSTEKVRQALLSASFSASLGTSFNLTTNGVVTDTNSPFYNAVIKYGVIRSITGSCSTPILTLEGLLSGSFGNYNGNFNTGSNITFDVCSGQWTSSNAEGYKILAVLADTQFGGIDTNLEAPGYSGSSMTYKNAVTKSVGDINDTFNLTLKSTDSTTPYGVYEFSLDGSSTKYITNVFGQNAQAGDTDTYVTGTKKEAAYLYKIFENSITSVMADKEHWYISGSFLPNASVNFLGEPLDFTDEYSLNLNNGDSQFSLTNASTPWVISQQVAPWDNSASPTRYRLFRFHTLSDGSDTNKSLKIEISNVKLAGTVPGTDWGSFTVSVRRYSDTDKKPVILETFQNVTLDPKSSSYILRVIGDRYDYINYAGKVIEFGTHANRSKVIRVEMNDNPWPTTAVPYGFEAYATPVNSSVGRWTPVMRYTKASVYGLNPGKFPSGIVFDDAPTGADSELLALYPTGSTGNGVADDNKQYFAPLPEFGAYPSIGGNSIFALDEDISAGGIGTGSFLSGSNIVPSEYDAANETTYAKMRKFVFGFQGGFDGQSPAISINVGSDITAGNTQGLNCTNINSAGSIAYKQCIGALGNADEFDINLIALPGITHQHHPYVTNLTVDMCETRADVFYIMDLHTTPATEGSVGQIDEVVGYADAYDTSYAAAYYPWVKILDTNTNTIVTVPPSVVLPAVYATNDKIAAEWYAPAGLNRGGIQTAVQVCDRTTHSERDVLYEGRVNPIAVFPGTGIAAWGQKTLQVKRSALDRINVRRMLINIKKYATKIAKNIVFEPNVAVTRNSFLARFNPYLESVQQRYGLYAFQVVMDDTNNTPDVVDANQFYCQLALQPTRTGEFFLIDMNVYPTNVTLTF